MALIVVTIVAAFTLGRAQASSSTEAGPLDSASLTFLGVRAGGHETLADVKSRLGATEIWETGDASTSTSQICYRVPSLRPFTVLRGPGGRLNVPQRFLG